MAQTNTNIAKLKNKVDFGIITIREDEFEVIFQILLKAASNLFKRLARSENVE